MGEYEGGIQQSFIFIDQVRPDVIRKYADGEDFLYGIFEAKPGDRFAGDQINHRDARPALLLRPLGDGDSTEYCAFPDLRKSDERVSVVCLDGLRNERKE